MLYEKPPITCCISSITNVIESGCTFVALNPVATERDRGETRAKHCHVNVVFTNIYSPWHGKGYGNICVEMIRGVVYRRFRMKVQGSCLVQNSHQCRAHPHIAACTALADSAACHRQCTAVQSLVLLCLLYITVSAASAGHHGMSQVP